MAKDLYHDHVKMALSIAGWSITHDPYKISVQESTAEIDLGAEKLIGARKNNLTIAVEIKSFLRESKFYDFHAALGQYMVYLVGLDELILTGV